MQNTPKHNALSIVTIAFLSGMPFVSAESPVPVEFSKNFVPVQASEDNLEYATRQHFLGPGVVYAICVLDGDAVELALTQLEARAPVHPPSYTLKDANGGEVASASIDGPGEHVLHIKVPGKGVYFFEYDDGLAGWQPDFSEAAPCALVLEKDKEYLHSGAFGRRYFYVPKGTKEIRGFAKTYGPMDVTGPDNVIVQKVNSADGADFSIPVSEGQDGLFWSLGGDVNFTIGQIWFDNVPNVLSASPKIILVPRETAEKDGLSVISQ